MYELSSASCRAALCWQPRKHERNTDDQLFATFALGTIFAQIGHVKIVFFIQKRTKGGIKLSLTELIIRSQRKAILVTNFKTLAVMKTLISLKFLIYQLSYIFLYLEEIQRIFVFYCVLVPNISFLSHFILQDQNLYHLQHCPTPQYIRSRSQQFCSARIDFRKTSMISSPFADQELETYGNSWNLSNREND